MESLTWDDVHQLWRATAGVGSAVQVAVAVVPGAVERDLSLAYARLSLTQLAPRINQARSFAARRLLEYYNHYNAHLKGGEQLTAEAFAERLQLEGIRFSGEGQAQLHFGHDLYRGDYLFGGGLVVVEATAEGRLRKAYWVTEPDAREPRRTVHGR